MKEKPGRTPPSAVKLLADPAAMLAQSKGIKAAKIFGV
jgi:hypothetical protein